MAALAGRLSQKFLASFRASASVTRSAQEVALEPSAICSTELQFVLARGLPIVGFRAMQAARYFNSLALPC
ncbi:hypothetical protein ACP70R_013077 [Stipagrostis hirtigluma subsp. patula]